MSKKSILLVACCLICTAIGAQNAQSTMESFVKKMNAYSVVEMDFVAKLENMQDHSMEEQKEGTLLYSGSKFRILMQEVEVYCDGKSKWIYQEQTDEVMIFPTGEAKDITDNPLEYITANYKNGFKYKQKAGRTETGKQLKEIEMYPTDRKSNYISIILTFESKSLHPYTIKYNTKDGINYTIRITRFNTEAHAREDSFTFPAALHPNVEIVDLRK